MDALASALRRQRAARVLLPLFLLSGATGLIYQTVWSRELQLLFGTSTLAIATVLAAFMAGLAVGGAAMARVADRVARPLRLYGALEIGIGVYAAAFPWVLDALTPAYLAVAEASAHPWLTTAVRFGIAGSALLPPTAAMGATLPLLSRFAVERLGAAGDRVGRLYAANTAGAVLGTAAAGFVLLPELGLWATTTLAAGANVALGVAALLLDRWVADAARQPPRTAPPGPRSHAARAAALSSGLGGFAALVLEVAWFRVLGLMVGGSTYAFSTMLLAFLVGLTLGGALGGPLGDRAHARGGPDAVLRALAVTQLATAALALGLTQVWPELPWWYVWWFDLLDGDVQAGAAWAASLVLAGVVMTPATTAMGVAFPLAARAAMNDADAIGGDVGGVYATNTVGGVAGAALAGFVVLPAVGIQGTVVLAAIALVGAALVAWFGARSPSPVATRWGVAVAAPALVAAGLFAQPPWEPLWMTAGMYKYASSLSDRTREGIRAYSVDPYRLLFYAEGPSSVVTVAEDKRTGNRWLANNGKVDASTTMDMPTQLLVSLLPMAYVDRPAETCVIGLASGISAGAAGLPAGVDHLDVVELEPAIVHAARLFDDHNFGVLDDPRVRLIVEDGRSHLTATRSGAYDVIVSEPSNPWISGVSNLFTAEFFALGRTRVRPGGAWSQWIQLYGMDDLDLASLLGTFADVWPHVLVFTAAEDADLVLVGTDHPIAPTVAAAARLLDDPAVAAALARIDVTAPLDLIAHYLFDRDAILALADGVPRNTDDNLRIESRAPRNLHRRTQSSNLALLQRAREVPHDALGDDPALLVQLAHAYRHREDARAVRAMVHAVLRLPEGSDARAEAARTAYAWWLDDLGLEEGSPIHERRFLERVVTPVREALP